MNLSKAKKDLQIVRIMPSELNLTSNEIASVMDGGLENNFFKYSATSVSGGTINIKMPPPSYNAILHPVMYKRVDLTVSVTVANGNAGSIKRPFASTAQPAPRSFPLSRLTQNETIHVGQTQFSNNYQNRVMDCLQRFNNNGIKRQDYFSGTVSQPSYGISSSANTGAPPNASINGGDKGAYSFLNQEQSAASGAWVVSIDNSTVAASSNDTRDINFVLYEPIIISPFFYSDKGFTHIRQMSYMATLSNYPRILQIIGDAPADVTYTNLTLQVNSYDVLAKYTTPKDIDPVPKSLMYDHREYYFQESTVTNIAGGAEASLTINSQNLSSVPSRVFVWAEEQDADRNVANTDNFFKSDVPQCSIENVSIQYNNRSALLSNATKEQLYFMSRKNGCNLNYTQWARDVGSYIMIDVAKDLGLNNSEAPSTQAIPQFGVTCRIKNLTGVARRNTNYGANNPLVTVPARNINYVLRMLIVYDGLVKDVEGVYHKQNSILTSADVLKSSTLKAYDEPARKEYLGGAILPALATKILPIVRGVRKAVQTAAPIAKKVADFGETVGLGKKPKAGRIGGRIGGRKIKRRMLK